MQIGADYDLTVPSCSSAIKQIEIEPQLLNFDDSRVKTAYRIHLDSRLDCDPTFCLSYNQCHSEDFVMFEYSEQKRLDLMSFVSVCGTH